MILLFFFSVMLLLFFLEACIGRAFDLWPAYVHEILFSKPVTPESISALADFMYGHDVPLRAACKTYIICNPDRNRHYLIPFAMGGYYANFYCRRHVHHIAQYHDVPTDLMMWVNGRDHYQLEPVLPNDQLTPPLDCRPLRHCQTVSYAATVYSRIPLLCSVPAFDILRL